IRVGSKGRQGPVLWCPRELRKRRNPTGTRDSFLPTAASTTCSRGGGGSPAKVNQVHDHVPSPTVPPRGLDKGDHTMTSNTSFSASDRVRRGLADQFKGGVIMDVVTPEQARIAEDAGATAVLALERVPADIRAQGGASRMSDPDRTHG